MNLSEADVQVLRSLIKKSPALLEQLKQSKSSVESASLLIEAARQDALPIDEAALRVHFEHAFEKNQIQKLSDAQLDAVAGGQLAGDNSFYGTLDYYVQLYGMC